MPLPVAAKNGNPSRPKARLGDEALQVNGDGSMDWEYLLLTARKRG